MEQELENVEETQQVDESKFESAGDDSVIKVDLSQPTKQVEENADTEQETTDLVTDQQSEVVSEVVEEIPQGEETVQDDTESDEPVLEEVTDEEVIEVLEEAKEAIAEAEATGAPLPENIQKLVDFMEETGGDIGDYVRLNQDYSQMDNLTALQEYYKLTKPHLDAEERSFLLEESFSYDEDEDDDKDIRRKKIALKEQVAEAKAYLDGQKSKYYEDIKAGSKLTSEQQNAIDFFNRYNEESEVAKTKADTSKSVFNKKTENVFNDKFKGFEYNVGEKKYRFNVKNAGEVKNTQSDINNFIKRFLNKDGTMSDAKGYHKSLYTAMNADAVAQHFYEQGKADALKNSVTKSKNVDMSPRQSHGSVEAGGLKFKVLGENTSDFKFKIKNRK
jgi:hypothetical protein